MRTTNIIINRYALKHNLRHLRKLAPAAKVIAIVKANAYGHGLLEITKTLSEADAFGVAHLEDAMYLRENGITHPILLLTGFLKSSDLKKIAKQNLHTVIHNKEQVIALEMEKLNQPVVVWIKLDVGMHRLGIGPKEADILYQRLSKCRNVCQPVNIISHFSYPDDPKCEETKRQLNIFNNFCMNKPGMRSISSSGGILLYPQSHLDWIRPGIILYGISPLKEGVLGRDFGFLPVMSLTSTLIKVRKHKIGESVSYGNTWISKRNTFIGIVAIGYSDGYPRDTPSGTPVLISGREVPIVGRVTMNMLCIDLGPKSLDKVGDSVILWGEGLPVEYIAQKINISVYELITRLTSRIIIK